MRNLLFSLIAFATLVPVAALAQQNLVNLPIGETGDFNDYINAVYLMFISIAALIAVVKIIIAGVKYMFSDIVTQKSEAKRDIQGALLGLLVVLSAVVVLTIINPDLTNFDPDITGIEERQRPVITNESQVQRDAIIENERQGGRVATVPTGTQAQKRATCENIDQAKCTLNGADCYKGEYVTAPSGNFGYCVIPPENNVKIGDVFSCSPIEDYTGQTIGTDCDEAEARCTAAGYEHQPTSFLGIESSNRIECVETAPEDSVTIFPCIDNGRGNVDCTAAEALCTGERVATRVGATISCE